jgi:hypothetical protein
MKKRRKRRLKIEWDEKLEEEKVKSTLESVQEGGNLEQDTS